MKDGRQSNSGVALVIVMLFMAIILVAVLAFFSQSILQRQISRSSGSLTAVEYLAQGGINATISDLKQEIIAGSTANTVTTGSTTTTLYYPTTNAPGFTTMAPARVGSDPTLPNLIKTSAYGAPFYSGVGYSPAAYPPTGRASNVSTISASSNGRSISLARWNLPLLLPKRNSQSSTDYTPTIPFVAPNWIFVSRAGANPTTLSFSGPSSVVWSSSAANTSAVVGRYAYAIYDEGGTLDANVAGYPNTPGAVEPPLFSPKGSLAFADLTQLPGINSLSNPQGAINALVGWRNNASLQVGGTLPNYSYSSFPTAQTLFDILATTSPTGFLTTASNAVNNLTSATDHMFVNRQQLISFLLNEVAANSSDQANLQNAMQYLGTFSRYLDQPSVWPNPNRPMIQSAAGSSPASYRGGNDQYGQDNAVNPSFLSIRVATPFLRADGSIAVVGEPLVKHRFPLSWLAVLYPASPAKPNATQILTYFGLTSAGSSTSWTYNHGGPDGKIMTIAQVAALSAPQAREPDFFELLKAAICAGSLAKAAAPYADVTSLQLDSSVDYQVMQIGANIIDQTTNSGYPSSIQLGTSTVPFNTNPVFGMKDLPYLYEVEALVVEVAAAPIATPPPLDKPVSKSSGSAVILGVPVIWDPVLTPASSPPPGPSQFRLLADTTLAGVTLNSTSAHAYPAEAETGNGPTTEYSGYDVSWSMFPGSSQYTGMTFSTSTAVPALFREPTPLMTMGLPSGSNSTIINKGTTPGGQPEGTNLMLSATYTAENDNVAATISGEKDINSGKSYIGLYAGGLPLKWTTGETPPKGSTADTTYQAKIAAADISYATYYLQYWNAATSSYITYDQKINGGGLVGTCGLLLNANAVSGTDANSPWLNSASGYNRDVAAVFDPRTNRFGWSGSGPTAATMHTTGSTDPTLDSWRPGTAPGDTIGATQSPPGYAAGGAAAVGFNLGTGGIANPGIFSQNTTTDGEYYIDPDGIPRGAMGNYASSSAVNGLPMVRQATTSRPIILNRAFNSVGELGVVFRGAPWKNIDFSTPSSGDSALLDVFCINAAQPQNPLRNGSVDLNTANSTVLQAVLESTQRDQLDSNNTNGLSSTEAQAIAQTLVSRTTNTSDATKGPLINVGDLVGRYVSGSGSTAVYGGFSGDLSTNVYSNSSPDNATVHRYREAAIRALAASGNVRVWNLMLDIVAQTGRFPTNSSGPGNFLVEGERRYWVHLAIDRYTGQVLDSVTELVKQ
jgi:hypothetical protein